MELIFTFHAIQRIRERDVLLRDILKCLVNPDRITHIDDKIHFMKLNNEKNKLLICVCSITKDRCKIITIIYTSKIFKYFKDGEN